MTIHLPKDLESSINAAVLSGHFASDDAMTEAARLLLQKLNKDRQGPTSQPRATKRPYRQISRIRRSFRKISAHVPDEDGRPANRPFRTA